MRRMSFTSVTDEWVPGRGGLIFPFNIALIAVPVFFIAQPKPAALTGRVRSSTVPLYYTLSVK